MSKRDRISEILAVKHRSGPRRRRRVPNRYDLEQLERFWATSKHDSREIISDLLPIRIVTLIEVFCRYWIEILIDREGSPYAETAANLKIDLKFDFEMVRGLQGRLITLGEVMANALPLTNLPSIATSFSTLLGTDLFPLLANTCHQSSLEHQPNPVPIISDVAILQKRLARLFEVRHIVAHELPADSPHQKVEIDDFFEAAGTFISAMDEALMQLLYPRSGPITQQAMNRDARERSEAASAELEALCAEIEKKSHSRTIHEVQQAWRIFQKQEAHRQAETWTGGTMYPLIFHSSEEAVARSRIAELQNWIENEDFVESNIVVPEIQPFETSNPEGTRVGEAERPGGDQAE
jgi:hypothetical protein